MSSPVVLRRRPTCWQTDCWWVSRWVRGAVPAHARLHTGSLVAQGNPDHVHRGPTPLDHGIPDPRFDEDYTAFYSAMAAQGRKLPPPVDSRTLYQELPGLLQHKLNAHGQLHGGLGLRGGVIC